jgi:TolB protein
MPSLRTSWFGVLVVAGLLVAAVTSAASSTSREIAYCFQPLYEGGLRQIYVINSDGTGNRKLITADIGLNHHSWAPDGGRLAAVGYVDEATWSIYTFRVDGTGLTRLTHTAGVWDNEPVWSPDGTTISFTRLYPQDGYRMELWMMDSDGGHERWIGVQGTAAQWSPDGSRLIYTAERNGVGDIYTCSIDGRDERQITHTTAVEANPTWSPDGTAIAFSRSEDGSLSTWEIYVMASDGTGLRRLTNNSSLDDYPRWSPDGTMLCFGSDRSESSHWEIYTMAADGSSVMRVTYLPAYATAINGVWRP